MTEPKTMEEIIELAKEQVKAWYNPETNREWIETDCSYNTPDNSNDGGYLKTFVLQGGEPKGVVIVNYHDKYVTAIGIGGSKMKIYRLARGGWKYDEIEPNISRSEE